MSENVDSNNALSNERESNDAVAEYLHRASLACDAGDAILGMHLYLAAFEKAQSLQPLDDATDDAALDGLKCAWRLACAHKERSLAEYIFEKLEPYLSSGEIDKYADELQDLAIDKLEEFGFSRDTIQDITDAISSDVLGPDARLLKVEQISSPTFLESLTSSGSSVATAAPKDNSATADIANAILNAMPQALANMGGLQGLLDAQGQQGSQNSQGSQGLVASQNPQGSQGAQGVENPQGSQGLQGLQNVQNGQGLQGPQNAQGAQNQQNPQMPQNMQDLGALFARAMQEAHAHTISAHERITYKDLVGYDDVIKTMHTYGIGLQHDSEFEELIDLLNARHGLDTMPVADTLLFCSPEREDADHFMAATLGELNLPAIRMHMEENMQGLPVLCVMVQADNPPKLNAAHDEFTGAGVLMLEDLDMWLSPTMETSDDFGGFIMAQLTRGAREAINLIHSAVENPEVYVLASATSAEDIDPFFLDLLSPFSVVEIGVPTPEDRVAIWMDIAREHPSLRAINRSDLVRYSAGIPRFDIYMAAREAIDQSYKQGLAQRKYIPVTRENIFEKLAAYQPTDSDEYHALEEAVIRDFRASLDNIDDLLD